MLNSYNSGMIGQIADVQQWPATRLNLAAFPYGSQCIDTAENAMLISSLDTLGGSNL